MDAARRVFRRAVTPLLASLMQDRSTFHKTQVPTSETRFWAPIVSRVPPIRLTIKQAVLVLQLRTGFWPSLGAQPTFTVPCDRSGVISVEILWNQTTVGPLPISSSVPQPFVFLACNQGTIERPPGADFAG